MDLVARLKAMQQEAGESDVAFARRLQLKRETWRQLRHGIILPGPRTLDAIMKALPDLDLAPTDFLLPRNAKILATSATKNAEKEAAHEHDEPG